ncbi:HNH endonuclease [Nocardioides sp. KC13]|uniref:HNH endonuclease n=1 Tax=Nocardioides turkmenicus TaxID=2711220 RepID=A0A6M1QZ32_9ACTN|nr:HNH endonuclease [Nocardioides sp. KC13]NGN92652.1 HNH endonuclease [Nocardioides sp. KC13]
MEPNAALLWSSHDLRAHVWLEDLAVLPEDAAPPLYMTPVPEAAVCSYGWEGCTHLEDGVAAVPWIESTQQITMRWWQKLSLVRQLEHDAEGDLCHRKKIESAPRRAGKSVGLRGGALWRMAVGPSLFGEPQNVIHTGSDLNICREVQRGAWNWAEAYGWTVTKGNGKEAVETDLARWLVRAQDGVYGYDCSLGLGDECWDVKPDTINEGLEPATLERVNPQLVLTSTAHRRATSLMRTELANALTLADPDVLLLLWGALADCDPSDPAVWRAASPHWSTDRERMIRAKYAAALAGEDDPEFDDPDPMRGFMAQYLNVWTIAEKRLVGRPVLEADAWSALYSPAPATAPDAVAVESWFEQGVSLAEAWRATDGTVTVRVTDFATVDEVARQVSLLGVRRPAIVGSSLADHPAWRANRVRIESTSSAMRAQVGELMRVLREGTLRHTASEALSGQVLALRVSPGVDGPRIRSTERADAIKAATRAASAAAAVVRRQVVTPSRYRTQVS